MGTLLLMQVALDLGLIAMVTVLLMERSKLRSSEDPRMSRGLQLLTSKIAIVQDLMDRSETTVKQLTQLLEAKQQDVQEAIENVERHLHRVHESMEKSKSIARMFQDKIPHEEIIERQNAAKYLKAAKLAHQGLSTDEISKQVEIPRGELELIVKLNRHNLVNPQDPAWLEEDTEVGNTIDSGEVDSVAMSYSLEKQMAQEAIANVHGGQGAQPALIDQSTQDASTSTTSAKKTLIYSHRSFQGSQLQETATIRPVIFKKIEAP